MLISDFTFFAFLPIVHVLQRAFILLSILAAIVCLTATPTSQSSVDWCLHTRPCQSRPCQARPGQSILLALLGSRVI